ncbi:MAG TPA: hypothetical protein VEB18_04350 [Candidatus Paceibacterota bacterium]|nr:hypothetical protein [Candidatus Paceibacterota bacterium]
MDLFRKLSTPEKIQDFLDAMPINHEHGGETCTSPAHTLERKTAHCLEGALLAAAALWSHGHEPLLLNLKSSPGDDDHAVALFRRNGRWGAISKTNHAVLRYRDPIYATPRELALSYFHEYFLNTTGKKTLLAYSKPFNLKRFGKKWITADTNLWDIAYALRKSPHTLIVPTKDRRRLRPASAIERKAGSLVEWRP